nr:PREDICTED: sorting nexin-29-like [Latimeria chalumnae]|eukprot:XP_014347369.1 PREDICTED: sorting nexin-29-like [Latimeria chalumnae]
MTVVSQNRDSNKEIINVEATAQNNMKIEPVFWYYVKEHLNKHELQRYYSLKNISTDAGRGRAWLRCALNEHFLERYMHTLLADRNQLSVFYEDWSFIMDEEHASMLPTMAAGLNSILFAINIDNKDLNGQQKNAPKVTDLLKESTQNVTSLLKESTQGVSTLFREITATSAVSSFIRPEQEFDPLPVVSKNVNSDVNEAMVYWQRNVEKLALPAEGSLLSLQMSGWTPLQVLNDNDSSDILFPVSAVGSYSQSDGTSDNLVCGDEHESAILALDLAQKGSELQHCKGATPAVQASALSNLLPSAAVPDSMTINGEQKKNRWKEHFQEVLNRPPPTNLIDLDPQPEERHVNLGDITIEEVEAAISRLKNGKVAGIDNISAEILKNGGKELIHQLHSICQQIWLEEKVPSQWKKGTICKLPKKGDLLDCNNWRGITLLSVPGKGFCSIILLCIREAVDNVLREEQAGFRANRSCIDQIHVLRDIINKCIEFNHPIVISFIDFEKAFDSVHHPALWKIMANYGIPKKFISIISELYERTQCCVKVDGDITDWFAIETGVRQGCILSPMLFDDIAALAETIVDMETKTINIERESKKIGLKISDKKTKIMKIRGQNNNRGVCVNDCRLKEVTTFTYLGSVVSADGSLKPELDSRIGKTVGAFTKLDKILHDNTSSTTIKLRLYNAYVIPTLLENEVLKVQLKKYVGAVQMLKREGGQANDVLPNLWNTDGDLTVSESKSSLDNEELASSYERKLIEVAEMHGELIEFNERLHRALMAKEALVSQMRQELIDLRGPVPGDLSQTSEDQSLSDFETAHRALINVWIPSVFLRGKAASAYHVYQVYIRIRDDEWNVYRRYTEFRTLHHRLRTKYAQVEGFNFPPKKAIGNKDAKFVEERRKQLQSYLRNVMNKIIQSLPEFTASPIKETLTQLLPFCVDIQPARESVNKSSRSKVASRFPKLSRSHQRETRNLEPQSGDL